MWKKVSKEEAKAFVENYPNKLDWNVAGFCEPPMGSHNDFSDGKVWPESMVTKVFLNTAMKGHPAYKDEPDDYYILEKESE